MKNAVFVALALFFAGCATTPPTVQTGPNAEVSYDGLHVVDNSRFKMAWADPDADWARYNKYIPGPATFEFKAVKKGSNTYRAQSSQTEFWISEEGRARLKEVASEVFNEELAKSERFTVTDKPAADALIIRGALLDIVSNVPPSMNRAGRTEIYLSKVGEATLVIEAVDSLSGEVLFRAVERRAAESAAGGIQANTVTTWSEVRRMLRRWATRLKDGMDSLPTE